MLTTVAVRSSGRELTDIAHYASYATAVGEKGLLPYRDFALEYPPLALAVFLPPAIPPGTGAYYWLFVLQMAVLGAVGMLATTASIGWLGRTTRRRRATLALLAVSPVLFGSVVLTRFDLLPAAFVALATYLILTSRTRSGAVVLGLGVASKLYPVVLLPLLATWCWKRWGRSEAFRVTILTLGTASLVYLPFVLSSPEGVWSSLSRLFDRPLQIESLGAGVLIVMHQLVGLDVSVTSSYGSDNLFGDQTALGARVLSVLAAAGLLWVYVGFARGRADDERLVRYVAASLLAFVAFGKLGSPQFLIWLLFPLALVGGRRGATAATFFAVAALATAVWYPWRYFDLYELDPLVGSLVLVRGLALVAALAVLLWPGTAGTRD